MFQDDKSRHLELSNKKIYSLLHNFLKVDKVTCGPGIPGYTRGWSHIFSLRKSWVDKNMYKWIICTNFEQVLATWKFIWTVFSIGQLWTLFGNLGQMKNASRKCILFGKNENTSKLCNLTCINEKRFKIVLVWFVNSSTASQPCASTNATRICLFIRML